MLIHDYDPKTGQYLSSHLAEADPQQDGRWLIPACATPDPLPERLPKTWPFWQRDKWVFLPDHRGRKLYRMDNGEPCEILQVGVTPTECGLTDNERPSSAYIWCNGEWVMDHRVIKQQKHAAAMAEFEARMKKAITENIGKADAMAAGLLEGVDKALFKAWAAYQVELRGVINAPHFPEEIYWPKEPDENAIAQEVATAK